MSIINNKGYRLEKSSLTEDQLNKIKNDLIVEPNNTEMAGEDQDLSFPVYTENDKYIYMPKFYGITKFGKPDKHVKPDKNNKVDLQFISQLRDYQEPIVDKCHKHLLEKYGGMLSVGCGRGKTTMALNLACRLGYRTLVLVHKTFLQDQWIERTKQFTNGKIGIIRQDTVDIEGKDIVIGMVQSISMKDYDPKIFDNFDFLIVDEAHHLGSRVFSRSLQKIGAYYTLTLSATPKRLDGLTKVIHWHTGPIIYKEDTKPNKHVIARVFKYETDDPLFIEKKQWCKGSTVVSTVKMINNIVKIDSRNQFIINMINIIRLNPNRKLLILSDRLEHLKVLKDATDKLIDIDIKDNKLLKDECKTFYYVGGMKQKDQQEAETGQILFGTYAMAAEGLDIPTLNAIILASPKKNVTQAIGRVMRKVLEEGDIPPLIIDIADQLSIYTNQGKTRCAEYKKNDYDISIYNVFNDNIISYTDYLTKDNRLFEYNSKYEYETDLVKVLDTPLVTDNKDKVKQKNINEFFDLKKKTRDNFEGFDLSCFDD